MRNGTVLRNGVVGAGWSGVFSSPKGKVSAKSNSPVSKSCRGRSRTETKTVVQIDYYLHNRLVEGRRRTRCSFEYSEAASGSTWTRRCESTEVRMGVGVKSDASVLATSFG